MILKIVLSVVCLAALASVGYVIYDEIKMIKKAGGWRAFNDQLEDWLMK